MINFITHLKSKTILKRCIFLPVLFIIVIAKGQVYERKTIQSGESLSELSYYLFPSFEDAAVKFKKGGTLVSKMNFNLLICQMQFIDEHGDTLNIDKPAEIESIALSNNLFFYDEGYYEIIAAADSSELAVLRTATCQPVKIGALGLPNRSATGVESDTSLMVQSGEKHLLVREDIDVFKVTTYFLMIPGGEKVRANKAGFLNFFSKDKKQIQAYVKTNRPSFNKEADLKKLFNYCVGLH
jgi:hypothetical protein